MKELISEYRRKKPQIKKRLREFENLYRGKSEDIFSELCFCILTPQSKAVYCGSVINKLKKIVLNLMEKLSKENVKLMGLQCQEQIFYLISKQIHNNIEL